MKTFLFILTFIFTASGMTAEKSVYDRILSKAIKSGDFDRAKEMIEKGADVNIYKPEEFVTFNRKWMLLFVRNGYKLDREGECILRIFFWENRKAREESKHWNPQQDNIYERLKVLLRAGADPLCQNRPDEPLLVEISGEHGSSEVRSINYKHKAYINAFKLILKNARSQINEWFVETKYNFKGKNWAGEDKDIQYKALYFPIINNNKELFRALIEFGYDVNSISYRDINSSGMTALEGALYMKDLDLVKLVVERGADINIVLKSTRFKKNISPIDYAHEWVLDEIELYLLEKGAKYIIHKELNN